MEHNRYRPVFTDGFVANRAEQQSPESVEALSAATGCDTTFFEVQEASCRAIRDTLRNSYDPRISSDV